MNMYQYNSASDVKRLAKTVSENHKAVKLLFQLYHTI